MENLFEAIAFGLYAAAHLFAVIAIHRMKAPLAERRSADIRTKQLRGKLSLSAR